MNTDTSDALISNQEYRYAENIHIVTNINKQDGEVRLVDGVVLMNHKFTEIYGATSIRDYGIIIGKKNGESGWGIYRFNVNNDPKLDCIFGPCSENIGKNLSLVTRWESAENVKLYIADGENQIRSINIFHNDGAQTDVKYLGEYSNISLSAPTIQESNDAGHIKHHVLQYAYVLYKYGGSSTQSSPLSNIISLYKGNRGYAENEHTSSSVKITIDGISSNYLDRIILYRISYVQNGQDPTINVIFDGDFNESFVYTDIGSDISEISVAEFTALTKLRFKPQVIESKNNYLFAGNISYETQDVDNNYKDAILTIEDAQYEYMVEMDIATNIINPRISYNFYKRSLMRGETYRYGVVFYTKDGNRTSVLCITDHAVPYYNIVNDDGIFTVSNNIISSFGTSSCNIRAKGITFTLNLENLDENSKNNLQYYEIVRCERTINDSITVAQGIVGIPFYVSNDTQVTSPFMSLQTLNTESINPNEEDETLQYNNNWRKSCTMFACPEHCYDYGNIIQALKDSAGLYIEAVQSYIVKGSKNTYISNGSIVTIKGTARNSAVILWPDEFTDTLITNNDNCQYIDEIQEVVSPKWNDFATTDDEIRIQNDITIVGDQQYINWYAPIFFGTSGFDDASYKKDSLTNTDSNTKYTISSGKKCILFNHTFDSVTDVDSDIPVTVCNVRKNATPYGGASEDAKSKCIFYSFGNVYKYDSADSSSLTGDIFDGDCFVYPFIYNSAHYWSHDKYKNAQKISVVYCIPVESRIDLAATSGDLYNTSNNSYRYMFQDDPCSISEVYGDGTTGYSNRTYTQSNSAYKYDFAYSQMPYVKHAAIKYTQVSTDKFDTRVIYSEQKTNGELNDNWLSFKPANFLDVDTRYGSITNLRLFKDSLIFWQEHATGLLSVNERTIIQDANDNNIVLGNGDILQRYDYISTIYGMHKNQFCDTQSNTTLYWWDYDNRELLMYAGGNGAVPMGKLKNIQKLLYRGLTKIHPALSYDNKYKDVYMSIFSNSALLYNESLQQFVSVVDMPFSRSIIFSTGLYYIEDGRLYARINSAVDWSYGTTIDSQSLQQCKLTPSITYIVNVNPQHNKVFDTVVFGGEFYGGSKTRIDQENINAQNLNYLSHGTDNLKSLNFSFSTNLDQTGVIENGENITNREYDFRVAVPRQGSDTEYGNRLRGKTMECTMWSTSNDADFSLQYITTKYRMSWS